jgi:hypothetical protein
MTELLWAAVDRLTKPSRIKVMRVEGGSHSDLCEQVVQAEGRQARVRLELAGVVTLAEQIERTEGDSRADRRRCDHLQQQLDDIAEQITNLTARAEAAKTSWADIPSLWTQASDALTTGSESAGGRTSSINTRTPIDIDLMEWRATIRDTVTVELGKRRIDPRATVPQQIRQLAAAVVTDPDTDIAWWTYRFESWARTLATYVQAAQTQPRPIRLRGTACPECAAKQVIIESELGPVVAPPLLIDFREGYVRAAQCSACGHAWFRGEELEALAATVTAGRMTA